MEVKVGVVMVEMDVKVGVMGVIEAEKNRSSSFVQLHWSNCGVGRIPF